MTVEAKLEEMGLALPEPAQVPPGLVLPFSWVRVRGDRAYVSGHVPRAVLVPMGQLASRLGELDREHPVYVICATGNRSAAMTHVLRASGYDAYSVAGGTSAWARSGRPLEITA